MLTIGRESLSRARTLLCLGAHSDDIEIGAAGAVLELLALNPGLQVHWVVLSASAPRADEARASAERLLGSPARTGVLVKDFRERYFPYDPGLKEFFDELGRLPSPDVILAPWQGDAHQDHRVVAELASNTFRDHLILHYEIPKYDGDMGRPNIYVHLDHRSAERKVETIVECFASQKDRDWFSPETFWAMLRLRGIESRAPSGYAEAFHCQKLVLA